MALADQVSKAVALALLGDGAWSVGPIRLAIVRNPGGPFGVATGASLAWTVVAAAIVTAAVAMIASGRAGALPVVAIGIMIGGGVGNLIDRLVRVPGLGRGAVVDWIELEPYPRVFNLADVALRAGAVVVLVVMSLGRRLGS